MPRFFLYTAVTLATTACADLPDLNGSLSKNALSADYPVLQPIDQLIARADGTVTQDIQEETQRQGSRIAALKRKASQLQSPVLTRQERRRLAQALKRHAS